MKVLCIGDLHLRSTQPKARTDEFPEVQLNKLDWALTTAVEQECCAVLQAGDFFNSPNVSYTLYGRLVENLFLFQLPIFCVYGQHDLPFHNLSLIDSTPLHSLSQSGFVNALEHKYTMMEHGVPFHKVGEGEILIAGLHWGEKPDFTKTQHSAYDNAKRILIAHVPVGDRELYPGDDVTPIDKFAAKMDKEENGGPWDLILCGDRHFGFHQVVDGTTIVNCGALTRCTIDEKDREPMVGIMDFDSGEYEELVVPHDFPEKVFREVTEEEERGVDETIAKFLDTLRRDNKRGINLVKILGEISQKEKVPENVRDKIASALSDE